MSRLALRGFLLPLSNPSTPFDNPPSPQFLMLRLRPFLTLFALLTLSLLSAGPAGAALPDGLYARMETSKGAIVLRLFYQQTPQTVANFVGLASGTKEWQDPITKQPKTSNFYDGLSFHRVIDNFMIQGGDPLGTGAGGPGYQFADEIVPTLKHDKPGTLSMANAGPNTNGSQFFITHVPTPWLDGKHSVFGEVVEGMDVVNAIAQGDLIEKVTIEAVGADAEAFDPKAIEADAAAAMRKLAEKNKKTLPEATGKLDPKKVPESGQPQVDEVSLELLVIAYQGSRSPRSNLYYNKEEAQKVAAQIADLARREGVNFAELSQQLTDLPEQPKLPMLARQDPQLPEFFQPVFTLKEGQISDPVDTPFGYIVFHRVPLELITARHILIQYQGAARATQSRSRDEALALAQDLAKRAQGGENFEELAKSNSDGPSAPQGGMLGRFPRGQMVPEFEAAAFLLKPGEVSGVVETPFGFHVIQRVE